MSCNIEERDSEVDLSKLISYTMSFQPLQLLFQDILNRLKKMESEKERQDDEIERLKQALEEVRQRNAESESQVQQLNEALSGGEGSQPVDLSSLKSEVDEIKRIMGNYQRAGRRRTIEELYAARRRESSFLTPSEHSRPKSAAASRSNVSEDGALGTGDIILNRVKKELLLDEEQISEAVMLEEIDQSGETVEPPQRGGSRQEGGESGVPSRGPKAKEVLSPGEGSPTQGDTSSVVQQPAEGRISPPFHQDSSIPETAHMGYAGLSTADASGGSNLPWWKKVPYKDDNSIFDRLKKDGADIEHLNRVVAEILTEMQGLHKDIDQMFIGTGDSGQVQSTPMRMSPEDLIRRVEALEDFMRRFKERGSSPAESLTEGYQGERGFDSSDDHKKSSREDDPLKLMNRIDALEKAQGRVNSKLGSIFSTTSDASGGETGISSPQLALISGSLDALERQLAELQRLGLQNYDRDMKALWDALKELQGKNQHLDGDSGTSHTTRAPRTSFSEMASSRTEDNAADYAKLNELMDRMKNMQQRICDTEANVRDLDEKKANRSEIQHIKEELQNFRHLLELGAGKNGDDATGLSAGMQEEMLRDMQSRLDEHEQKFNTAQDESSNGLEALREYVEQIDHRKADAQLVANKAERDYVENALERLMREVEQVLNATNAGLIDTLDKSLNVLRDMLDGKATKNDMASLQRIVGEEHVGLGAPDALVGFRGFRCLGCNRPVEKLRPRAMGSRLQPFVSRLPHNLPPDNVTARIQQGPSTNADTSAPLNTSS